MCISFAGMTGMGATCLHTHRVAGGHRRHRDARSGCCCPRCRQPREAARQDHVRQPPQADRPGRPQLPRYEQGLPPGREPAAEPGVVPGPHHALLRTERAPLNAFNMASQRHHVGLQLRPPRHHASRPSSARPTRRRAPARTTWRYPVRRAALGRSNYFGNLGLNGWVFDRRAVTKKPGELGVFAVGSSTKVATSRTGRATPPSTPRSGAGAFPGNDHLDVTIASPPAGGGQSDDGSEQSDPAGRVQHADSRPGTIGTPASSTTAAHSPSISCTPTRSRRTTRAATVSSPHCLIGPTSPPAADIRAA